MGGVRAGVEGVGGVTVWSEVGSVRVDGVRGWSEEWCEQGGVGVMGRGSRCRVGIFLLATSRQNTQKLGYGHL